MELAGETAASQPSQPKNVHSARVVASFDARRNADDPIIRKQLSKQLWRALRRQRRIRQEGDFINLAESGRGSRQLARLHTKNHVDKRIAQLRDDAGVIRTGSAELAEVFASFFESLYKAEGAMASTSEAVPSAEGVNPVTVEEVEEALRKLKSGRSGADDGLVAEMLKTGHTDLLMALAAFFLTSSLATWLRLRIGLWRGSP